MIFNVRVAGSKSAKLVVSEYGKLVARILQYIACLTRVQIYNKSSHVALCFAVFHSFLDYNFKKLGVTVAIQYMGVGWSKI